MTSCRIARNFAGWVLNVMTFLALKNSLQTGNSNGFLQTVFNALLSFHLIAGFAGNVFLSSLAMVSVPRVLMVK